MNKKGFTLIEVIAVITIIGVLSGTVIAGVGGSLSKTHDDYCTSQVDMMIVAGRDYFHDRTSLLPLEIGAEECVNLTTLTNDKYIEQMKDYQGALCNTTNSKVCATKVTGNDYYYAGYLDCGKCATDNTKAANESIPKITFNPNSGTAVDKDITVEMKIEDEKNEIISYAYTIYEKKEDGRFAPYKKVDFREYKKKKITITLNKKGTFYIEGYAYNSIGKKGTGKSGEYILDYSLNCDNSAKISASNGNGTTISAAAWVKGVININVEVTGAGQYYDVYIDKDNSGYKQIIRNAIGKRTISYDEKQSGKYTVKMRIYDKYGNSCETAGVTYYQDNTPPTCDSNPVYDENHNLKYNSEWTNKNINILPICTDKESGCDPNKNLGNLVNSEFDGLLSAGRVYDMVGNYTDCPNVRIKIDKTKPTCEVNLSGTAGNNNYYRSDVTANITGSDIRGQVNSGVASYSLNTNDIQSFSSSTKAVYNQDSKNELKYYGYVKDQAGNIGKCESRTFKLDKTKPTCNGFTGARTGWAKNLPTINIKCADSTSECEQATYRATLGNTSAKTLKTTTATARIYDKAGNHQDCNYNVNVYRDDEAPSCGTWQGNSDWTKNDVVIRLGCDDNNGSGCISNPYRVKTYSANNSVTNKVDLTQKICDWLGNCRSCSKNNVSVKHDTKKPTCSISINGTKGKNNWYINQSVTGTIHSSDNGGSGIRTATVTNSPYRGDTKNDRLNGKVVDKAGNSNTCHSAYFKQDSTAPSAAYGNANGWVNRYIVGTSFTFRYWDATSGVGTRYASAHVYSKAKNDWCTTGWGKEDGSSFCPGYYGKYWRGYYAEDNAGNKSSAVCWYLEGTYQVNGSISGKTCTVNAFAFTP